MGERRMSEKIQIVDVSAENIRDFGFCGFNRITQEGYRRKTAWLKKRFAEGMKCKVLHTRDEGTVGFIEEDSTAYIGELGEEVNVVKSTVSHHIKELKRVGLIRTERQGQKIACWVDPQIVEDLREFFDF